MREKEEKSEIQGLLHFYSSRRSRLNIKERLSAPASRSFLGDSGLCELNSSGLRPKAGRGLSYKQSELACMSNGGF